MTLQMKFPLVMEIIISVQGYHYYYYYYHTYSIPYRWQLARLRDDNLDRLLSRLMCMTRRETDYRL